MEDSGNQKRCEACGRNLETGSDVLVLQRGVVGLRGPVPVEDAALFCGESCLRDELGEGRPVEIKKRRIP